MRRSKYGHESTLVVIGQSGNAVARGNIMYVSFTNLLFRNGLWCISHRRQYISYFTSIYALFHLLL
jgi:hypothetical protein